MNNNGGSRIRIVGGKVVDESQTLQFFDAFVVSSLGSDLTGFHHFVSGNSNGVFEAVHVPSLKEGEVQTDVGWVEGFFMCDLYEEACEVFDVVHFLFSVFCFLFSVVSFLFSVDSCWFNDFD
jgi:hypothetical protein